MALSVGARLGNYEVSGELGAGGMGEVYRATDTKLGRNVALKVLPAEMARDPERMARFQREAKAMAALNHPHIVTIYSVEESNDIHFLTMELVEGQSLDRMIPEAGLPVEQIVEIAGALAAALSAAHEKGIIHRDLKPSNVMVTDDGRVKVLDFGLAKETRPVTDGEATVTSAHQTQAGVVMGTPAYMSPEQVSGRALDHRSDIFSLGVVLHEMATGKRPFDGTSSAELVSAILRDSPLSVSEIRPDLPADLARVIRRCLEKDPRYRMQTARDVGNEFRDLARLASGSSRVTISTSRAATKPGSGASRADEGFWVAVLPFKYTGSNQDLAALAEGLTEDVVTSMSKFSYLRVLARSSTARFAHQAVDLRVAAKELGARYVMEGSLRQAGAKIRIAVQLIDASTGAGLWAETYDRPFTPETTLELLDDVVPRIVATVGDTQGVLAHSMTDALRNRDPESLTPYEAVLRSFGYHQLVTAAEHQAGIKALENAVKTAPDRADCWAMLAWLIRGEFTHNFNPRPDPLGRSLAAARRAIEAEPSNAIAHAALASTLFCRRDFPAFRTAAQRALALNRLEGYATAYLGLQIAYAGDWEQGCALAERATQLNPNHPGWYWLPLAVNAYRENHGQRALEYALKVNMPGLWTAQFTLAVIYSQLGEMEKARTALGEVLALRPDFSRTAREELEKWWLPDMVEQMLGDLRKAGFGAPESPAVLLPLSGTAPARTASGETRADEGFWVAVLPFRYAGSNVDLKALAEGLSEEVITGLSRFSYLRVIARGSTVKYSSESGDVRAIGKELGARYVMEGGLRQAGNKLRLAVQLVDAASGSHLWAETYERAFSSDTVFEVQDDLVPRIVSTVADMNGVLARSMSEAVRSRDPEKLSPYEAVLRSFGYGTRATAEELSASIDALELAVRKAPSYGDAWGALAQLYGQDYAQGFNLHNDSLDRAHKAAQRAVELAPTNYLGYCALAQALFFQKEIQSFRNAAERAVALNPMDGNSVAFLGELLTYTGDSDRGLALAERAKQLNPAHPGWYWYADFYHAYGRGDYRGALGFALKVNLPGHWFCHAAMAAAYGQLGEVQAAAKAARDLLSVRPNFGATAKKDIEKWWDSEFVERLIEGWRKAGLEIADNPPKTLKPAAASVTGSGATRADEGFWVAVLPFKAAGMGHELKALADGLAEGIVTGLSRFSYLRVIAHGSTLRYADQHADLRVVGKELGARYVMDGTFRLAGTRLRVSVQLVDATSGAHLWAETYDRTFTPEAIFDLQDDLVPRIVSTVADWYGVLPHSMSEAVRAKGSEQLTPYEAVLRSFGYYERVNPEEHAVVRGGLERAVQQAPGNADAWAMLAMIYGEEFRFRFNVQPDSLERSLRAAKRAVDAAPSSHSGYLALAQAFFFRKEFGDFRSAAEQALALNPMDGATCQYLGHLLAFSGDWERGCEVAARARELNPHHPVWYWALPLLNAYHKGDYQTARTYAMKLNIQGLWLTKAIITAVNGQLGDSDAARKSLEELLALLPESAVMARDELSNWYPADLVESLLEGLRKAGLEIPLNPVKRPTPPV